MDTCEPNFDGVSRIPATRRALIGVTTSELRRAETLSPVPEGEPPRHEMALGITYMKAIEAAGGIPVVIPPMDTRRIDALLDHLDGLCLSGGPDIHPDYYGQEPDEHLGPTAPDLDLFELEMARGADSTDMPLLAICRGMQALNVSRGGSLIQHLPDRESEVEHRQKLPGQKAAHQVDLQPGSRVARIVGDTGIAVNSFHHQAIDRLGNGLVATGWAPDGLTESIEDPEREFLVGLQWHVELMVEHPEHFSIFREFVEAAEEYSAVRISEVTGSR